MKWLNEQQRSRSLRFQDLNLFCSETAGSFKTNVHMKTYVRLGMKIYTNELGYMTKMAAMPIYGKKTFFLQNQ